MKSLLFYLLDNAPDEAIEVYGEALIAETISWIESLEIPRSPSTASSELKASPVLTKPSKCSTSDIKSCDDISACPFKSCDKICGLVTGEVRLVGKGSAFDDMAGATLPSFGSNSTPLPHERILRSRGHSSKWGEGLV